jgi:hypothetical protein
MIPKRQIDFVARKLGEVVVVAIEEVGAGLLQALVELTPMPSLEVLHLMNCSVIKRRVSDANITKKGHHVYQYPEVKDMWQVDTSNKQNDGGIAALRMG